MLHMQQKKKKKIAWGNTNLEQENPEIQIKKKHFELQFFKNSRQSQIKHLKRPDEACGCHFANFAWHSS